MYANAPTLSHSSWLLSCVNLQMKKKKKKRYQNLTPDLKLVELVWSVRRFFYISSSFASFRFLLFYVYSFFFNYISISANSAAVLAVDCVL